MRGCRSWVSWLGLVVSVLWVGPGLAQVRNVGFQYHPATRLPLDDIPTPFRDRVRQVVDQPILVSRGPGETFAGDPTLYEWLLDHPDRAVQAWRRLGAVCTEVAALPNGWFSCGDGRGGEVHWTTVFDGRDLRIWYAEGKGRPPGVLLPMVPVRVVVLLYHRRHADADGRTVLSHQSVVYVQTDSRTAALVAKMLGPSVPRMAEQGLKQMEIFFSGIVWYLGQHPERTGMLLADRTCSKEALGIGH
jgi:hypothetical protein